MERKRTLIYSPKEKIPIGEPVVLPDGTLGIEFRHKRKSGCVTETVPMDKLLELVSGRRLTRARQESHKSKRS